MFYTTNMKRRFTEDSWRREPWFISLVHAFRSRKTDADMENFLRDIATLSELQALSERLEVARLLAKGLSYRQIAKETGASTTTVTRVASFIENGEGGYRDLLHTHRHHRLLPKQESDANAPSSSEALPLAVEKKSESTQPVTPLQKYLHRS